MTVIQPSQDPNKDPADAAWEQQTTQTINTLQHQVDNIKSFLFSEYFITHSEQWKLYNGNGFNDALIYLPPFDKTKSWTNEEVKEFIESFV